MAVDVEKLRPEMFTFVASFIYDAFGFFTLPPSYLFILCPFERDSHHISLFHVPANLPRSNGASTAINIYN